MNKKDLRSLDLPEIEEFISDLGEAKFRSTQLFAAINKNFVNSIDDITNISKDLRKKIKNFAFLSDINILKKITSKNNDTIKYLFELENNTIIESVFMKYDYGNTVCVSTQSGCRMGCAFCASTIDGLDRSLTAGEILAQVYYIQKDSNERISNVVLMGCGEPFDNFENVIEFIKIINRKEGLHLGQRSITISTCGIVPKIIEFANLNLQVNLAISLHAPNDTIRNEIMPISKKYDFNKTLEACFYYIEKTNRRITFEYALIDGINDDVAYAKELALKLKGKLVHVNLIPANDISLKGIKGSKKNVSNEFCSVLKSFAIETTIRRKLGNDIDAACGQLRKKYKENIF